MLLPFCDCINVRWIKSIFTLSILFLSITISFAINCPDTRNYSCPCGKTEKKINITCNSMRTTNDAPCDIFKFCETCTDYHEICTTCPPGRQGPYCTLRDEGNEEINMLKGQEKLRINKILSKSKRSLNCPYLKQPTYASMFCRTTGNQRECTARCVPEYWFENKEVEAIVLKCANGHWVPESSFPPECVEIKPKRAEISTRCQCLNGGICNKEGECMCPQDFDGEYCEERIVRNVYCPDPGPIENGLDTRDQENGIFRVGESVIYGCFPGYSLIGRRLLNCQPSGDWSSPRPSCQKITTTTTTTTTTTVKPSSAKIYDSCELGKELMKEDPEFFTKANIYTWLCIIKYSSSNNLSTIQDPGTGIKTYGLFQISDQFWCGPGKNCDLPCNNLLDKDLADDITCVKNIFKHHGFGAWGFHFICKDPQVAKSSNLHCDF